MRIDSNPAPRSYRRNPTTLSRFWVFILVFLIAVPIYISSSVQATGGKILSNAKSIVPSKVSLRNVTEASLGLLPFLPMPSPAIATYAGDCTTPKTVFNLQDEDKTVCAKIQNATPGWRVIWSNANAIAVQNTALTSGTQNVTFTLNVNSNRGDWRVILFDHFGGNVQAVPSFTVIDAENPLADLTINTASKADEAASGAQVVFALEVGNIGPSSATNAQFTDAVPANTTFVSFAQLSGPVFTCNSPNVGGTGTTNCSIPSLGKSETASFLATYLVDGGAASGSEILNSATVTSGTPDRIIENIDGNNNTSTASVKVTNAAPCVITTSENISVEAAAGQAGAVVTYNAPTSTGDCGQTPEGLTSPISCNPASGSLFPLGATTVLCAGQTGGAATFQVTVNSPGGGLSISLSGATPLTHECGTPFTDPGATAFDGSNQSMEVTITGPTIDRDTDPGTYTVTYSATDGTNSVSATRTINVVDTSAPAITIGGANPYRIQLGACSPFVDPGATANDDCAGGTQVTTSISGPGGLTSVDTNTAGIYTITYTSTDGTRQATATRTVIVGQFSEDEVDQPGSTNAPPTITLTGGDQMTIECGNGFTDPGATAAVCLDSVSVTTSGTVDHQSPGTYSITYSASANGITTTATRIVNVEDTVAPVISLTGASTLTVECHTSFTDPGATAHDGCAGDFAATATGSVDVNTVGQYTITYNATDPSGHSATPITRTVNVVDTTAPVVTAPSNVTVNTGPGATSCGTVVNDAALGTSSANDSCQGSLSVTRTGVPAGNVFPVGQTTITYSATDSHNNTGTAIQVVTVVDNTAPTISCATDITVYLPLNSTATSMAVTYTAPVGTDNCAGATTLQTAGLASGAIFPMGTTTNTFRVTDAAGNVTECSFNVTVLYNFTGFFAPVDNLPTLNVVTAGKAIPVKFSLSGHKGLNIFAAGSPYTSSINCDGTVPQADVEETLNAGSSSLTYDAASDRYHYVWKTENSWANTCRQLVVTLDDGSEHRANFKFK